MNRAYIIGLATLLTGCTTIGMHVATEVDFGSPDVVRLCAYLDKGILPDDAEALLDSAWRDEAPRYHLDFRIVRWYSWSRPAYIYTAIMDRFALLPMKPPCDRNIYFVGRHFGDVLWGLSAIVIPLPEVMGAVDDVTGTRIMVVARLATLAQVLTMPPSVALRHELEHALGCQHGLTMTNCYATIAKVKALHTKREDLFPAMALNGAVFMTWDEVEAGIKGGLK